MTRHDCPECTCGHTPAELVHLVFMDGGALFGSYFNAERASEAARNIDGFVASLPISEDNRAVKL